MRKLYNLLGLMLLGSVAATTANAAELPYTFDGSDCRLVATTNQGSRTWQRQTKNGDYYLRVQASNSSTDFNCWVAFEELDFVAGKTYCVTITGGIWYGTPSYTEAKYKGSFSVYFANATPNTTSTQTNSKAGTVTPVGSALFADTDFSVGCQFSSFTTRKYYFKSTETKTSRLALHNTSKGAVSYFCLSEFKVEECDGIVPAAPALTVTPDSDGLKKASFAVTAPTVDVFGQTLSTLSKLTVTDNGSTIYTVDNPTPGQNYTFTKEYGQVKTHPFAAQAFVGQISGPENAQSVLVGTDLGNLDWDMFRNYQAAKGPVGSYLSFPAVYVPGQGFKVTLNTYHRVEGALYDIVRQPGNVTVATDLETPEYIDKSIPADSRATYYYTITMRKEDGTTSQYRSNALSINNTLPYKADFSNAGTDRNSYLEFVYYDNDHDVSGWSAGSDAMSSGNNVSGGLTDNYLVSPGVKLEKGKYYRFKATLRGGYTNMSPSLSSYETWYGLSNDLASINIPLTPYTDVKERKENESYFTPPSTDNYFFAVRHVAYTKSNQLSLFDYSVEEVDPNLPDKVENLTVTYTGGTNARLTYKASPKNIAGQPQPSLTKIEILKDGQPYKTIENPTPGQEYTEDVTFTVGEQSIYSFVPYSASGRGTADDILVMLLNTPYTQEFTAPNCLDGYTVIDGGKDDYTWHIHNQTARSYPGSTGTMDEWLISPPVQLTKGMHYKVSADFACSGPYYDQNDGTRISLYMGTSPTIEGMTTKVIDQRQLFADDTTGDGHTQKFWEYVAPEETGQYFLAWRLEQDEAIAPPCEVSLDNFMVELGKSETLPDTGKLEVIPDPEGGEFVTCKIEFPTKNLKGEPFTSSTYVRTAAIFMDGETTAKWSRNNFTAAESGLQVRLTDIPTGKHKFTLMFGTGTSTGAPYLGRETEVYAYVGVNTPSHPVSFNAYQTNNSGEVKLEWEAPKTDALGFPIQPGLVSYNLYELKPRTLSNDQVVYDEIPVASNLHGTYTHTYQAVAAAAPQEWKRYVIRAYTTAGNSQGMLNAEAIPVGRPDALPYQESFAKLSTTHLMQNKHIEDASAMWGYNSKHPTYGVDPVDNDGGLALMEAMWRGSTSGLVTGNINITGKAPRLSLYLYAGPERDNLSTNGFNVQVLEGDNPWTIIGEEHPVHTWADEFEGWQKITLDLTPYVGKNVRLAFVGIAGSDQFTVMDHIVIDENPETDMAVKGIDLPEEVYAGVEIPVTVHYKNLGSHYKWQGMVELYRNGTKVAEKEIESPAGELSSINFTDVIPAADVTDNVTFDYVAKIVDEADVDLLDNTSAKARAYLVDNSGFPTVINLTGTKADEGVELSWEAPEIPTETAEVTDDFEKYTPWNGIATGIGQYTLIDADCSGISYIDKLEWPLEKGSLQSFFVADFSEPCFDYWKGINEDFFKAHSGNKVLASFTNQSTDQPVSDWLITPELSGEEQTITFWARVLTDTRTTSMTLLTSSTGKKIEDFTARDEDWVFDLNSQWRKISYTVPAGTKYAAIYNYGCAGTMLMIDDLSYTPLGNEALTLQAYRVYRDGELIENNIAPADAMMKYTDLTAKENSMYHYDVAVVYNRGEGPAQTAIVSTSGIRNLNANAPQAYGEVETIVIDNAEGQTVSIYTVDGAQVRTLNGAKRLTIPAASGYYVVTIGTKPFKVLVK